MTLPFLFCDTPGLSAEENRQLGQINSLKDLIFLLARSSRDIIVSSHSEPGVAQFDRHLAIQVAHKYQITNNKIDSIFIDGSYVKKHFKFKPLKEEMLTYADKPGYLIDQDWFDSRNARLKIKEHEIWGEMMLPVPSMTEVLLSYAYSTQGMVKISLEPYNPSHNIPELLLMELVFLGKDIDGEQGWVEHLAVLYSMLRGSAKRSLNHKCQQGIVV